MKNSIKSVLILIIISFLIIIIGYFLGSKKINNIVFDIYLNKKISLGNDFNLKGKDFNYKNINIQKKIGKGFLINSKGYFLTSLHNLTKTGIYKINLNNKIFDFKIIKKYPKKDIILGKINNFNYKNININFSKDLYLGKKIFTIKNNKKIYGKITGLNKNIKEFNLENLIETNIKLSPGDSGSPLFDKNNNIIGIFEIIDTKTQKSYAQKIPF